MATIHNKNKKKSKEKTTTRIILIVSTVIMTLALSANAWMLAYKFGWNTQEEVINYLDVVDGQVYNKTLKNVYEVEYSNSINSLTIKIKHPCVYVRHATGKSMLPYWEDETLVIEDLCYDAESLVVGDVVSWRLGNDANIHHRIIEIDKENRRFLTQGDNNPVNDNLWVSFDDLVGKDIGVLNVLMEKELIIEDYLGEYDGQALSEFKDYKIRSVKHGN